MPPSSAAGLCDDCRHLRLVTSARGGRYVLCRLHGREPAMPRYPRLPVLRCAGHAPAAPAEAPKA